MRFDCVPNRKTTTLLAIVSKYSHPGTVIHTDGWRGYSALSTYRYVQKKLVGEQNYVDPATGVDNQSIE